MNYTTATGRLAEILFLTEKRALAQAHLLLRGNRTHMAAFLGQSRRTIVYKMNTFELKSYAKIREAAALSIPELSMPVSAEAPVMEPANSNE